MKVRCPRCQSAITVPNEWAGRAIRCKACNKVFTLPKPQATIAPTRTDAGLDLEDLAKRERGAAEMDAESRAGAERSGEIRPVGGAKPARAGTRFCPFCQKEVQVKDPYTDVLCSNCWETIPALEKPGPRPRDELSQSGLLRARTVRQTGFYSGLADAFSYPAGALNSLLTSVLAGAGLVLLPSAMYIGVARAVEQGKIGPGSQQPERLADIEYAVTGLLLVELLFFAGVAVHGFLDVVRATSGGEDKAPSLTWNPSMWRGSILAYLSLIFYYSVCLAAALWLSGEAVTRMPTSAAEVGALLTPTLLAIVALFTFFVPMNLIGMSVGTIVSGLNPAKVIRSIVATHVNYLFLFLLVAAYATLYGLAFYHVVGWFGGKVRELTQAAGAGDVVEMAVGLLTASVVIGFGFYGIYLLGRLHGLFARSYRRELAF